MSWFGVCGREDVAIPSLILFVVDGCVDHSATGIEDWIWKFQSHWVLRSSFELLVSQRSEFFLPWSSLVCLLALRFFVVFRLLCGSWQANLWWYLQFYFGSSLSVCLGLSFLSTGMMKLGWYALGDFVFHSLLVFCSSRILSLERGMEHVQICQLQKRMEGI
ncbi:hypothetical protein K7X08_021435 [Anisodus acutangulus]|uniref:Transmembrane protein n=1 Tax=Anisodus acutangulus TaxID=402998 RepID=A0A9Q1M252_9SOLA|nr:hypothetical protein K7X08_021435 [Anisodus acutangulus]